MIENLTKQFEEFKSVVEVLPTNNKENRKKKTEYIQKEEENTSALLKALKEEIFSRTKVLDDLEKNLNINTLEEELKKCNIMNEWNSYNSSYEKMHLDYYLYQLHRYYKNDLTSINECLRKIIETFKKVNVKLTEKDFNYHTSVSRYLTLILKGASESELKSSFEKLYWQFPELINAIELNFKSIYLNHEKSIDKYFEERHNEYLKSHKDIDLINKKVNLIVEINDLMNQDPYTIFNLFKNRELIINDYNENDIEKKKDMYFKENSYSYDNLKTLYQILYEYSLILKYDYLFDKLKELLNNKDSLKNVRANALKEIQKEEKNLIKLASLQSPKGLFKKKKTDETWLFKYKESLNILIQKYEEFDDASFSETLLTKFSKDSTTYNALELISANYLFFVKETKTHLESDDMNTINDEYKELKRILNTNQFILLNRIALLDEYQMKQVIVDKYNLDGINLTTEELEPDNLEKTMKDIVTLIRYENLAMSNLKADDIKFYLDVEKDIPKEEN